MDLNNSQRCRVCLINNFNLLTLSDKEIIENQEFYISELLVMCANIQISETDNKPQNICTDCVENLKNAFEFKIICERSNAILNNELILKEENYDEITIKTESYEDLTCDEHYTDIYQYHCEQENSIPTTSTDIKEEYYYEEDIYITDECFDNVEHHKSEEETFILSDNITDEHLESEEETFILTDNKTYELKNEPPNIYTSKNVSVKPLKTKKPKGRKTIKRKRLTIGDKLKIIERLELDNCTASIRSEYGLAKSTLSDIIKNKEKLKEYAVKFCDNPNAVSNRKTTKVTLNNKLEEAVYEWCIEQKSNGLNFRGGRIQKAAKRIAQDMNYPEFSAIGLKDFVKGMIFRLREASTKFGRRK